MRLTPLYPLLLVLASLLSAQTPPPSSTSVPSPAARPFLKPLWTETPDPSPKPFAAWTVINPRLLTPQDCAGTTTVPATQSAPAPNRTSATSDLHWFSAVSLTDSGTTAPAKTKAKASPIHPTAFSNPHPAACEVKPPDEAQSPAAKSKTAP